jgi:hypothetical protein
LREEARNIGGQQGFGGGGGAGGDAEPSLGGLSECRVARQTGGQQQSETESDATQYTPPISPLTAPLAKKFPRAEDVSAESASV